MNEHVAELRKKAMRLPATPGVYIMRDKSRKIIYIGKAKALKKPRQPIFRLAEKPRRKGAPDGCPCRGFRLHPHRQRV